MELGEIYRAWAFLLAASIATTALTLVTRGDARLAVCGALLVLAGIKARTILSRYLELRHSAFWMRSFGTAISLFLMVVFAFYVIGSRSGG